MKQHLQHATMAGREGNRTHGTPREPTCRRCGQRLGATPDAFITDPQTLGDCPSCRSGARPASAVTDLPRTDPADRAKRDPMKQSAPHARWRGPSPTAPPDRRCNARTRAGTPCRRWGLRPSGRCRLHGGRSLRGLLHPGLHHGRRSKDALVRWLVAAEEAAARREAIAERARHRVRSERAQEEARRARDRLDGGLTDDEAMLALLAMEDARPDDDALFAELAALADDAAAESTGRAAGND